MFSFFTILIISTFLLELSPILDLFYSSYIPNFYIIFYIIFFYLNFLLNFNNDSKNINIDLITKYIILLIKTPNFFFNYILNIFKKIYIYLVHFKYRFFRNTTKLLYKKNMKSHFIWWRPLFKKSSYFGYYRSNRSKWIK